MAKRKTRSRRQQQRLPGVDANAMPISGEHAGREQTQTGSEVPAEGTVSLPLHLIDDILWHLSALECARLAAVCKSWACIASRRLADPAPHLFAFRSTATHRRGEVIAVPLGGGSDPSLHAGARPTPAHRALRKVTHNTECAGATASGRLVLFSSRRTVLFNPVTGTSRWISKVPGVSYASYAVHPMPVVPLGGDSFFHAGRNHVGIWRPEEDTWTVQHVGPHAGSRALRMAVLCAGSLYAMDADGYVLKVELPSLHTAGVAVRSLRYKYREALAGAAIDKGYLVEAGGEVLFVWPLYTYTTTRVRGKRRDLDSEFSSSSDDDDGDREDDDDYFFDDVTATLNGFDVYRLDMEEMQWVEEDGLAGDVALFVSRRSSFSVPASEKGCVSNCVYFVCDEGAGNTWGAFSLGERRMLFENAIGAAGYRERLWFYPGSKEPGLEDMAVLVDGEVDLEDAVDCAPDITGGVVRVHDQLEERRGDGGPVRFSALVAQAELAEDDGGEDPAPLEEVGVAEIQNQRYMRPDVYHQGGEDGGSRGVIAGGTITMIAGTIGVWIILIRSVLDVAELIRRAWRRGIRREVDIC